MRGGLLVVLAAIVIAIIAMSLIRIGPSTLISDLLIWVFQAVGAILEGFIEAFSPWKR